tara:strand:- start:21880 stop:22167 length:288 start_codon:yes stop_codon:yes gene_type:complete
MKCWKTKKVCYDTWQEANLFKEKTNSFISENDSDRTIIDHAYNCPHCKKYHLTSISRAKQKAINKQKAIIRKQINPTKLELIADRLEYLKQKYRL